MLASKRERKSELARLKILVVDDSEDIREMLEFILKSSGASVETARDGAEAVSKASNGIFDVILMDIRMPGLNGTETATQIRNLPNSRKIIAITGDQDTHESKKSSPFDGYLYKPINPKDLEKSILGIIG